MRCTRKNDLSVDWVQRERNDRFDLRMHRRGYPLPRFSAILTAKDAVVGSCQHDVCFHWMNRNRKHRPPFGGLEPRPVVSAVVTLVHTGITGNVTECIGVYEILRNSNIQLGTSL